MKTIKSGDTSHSHDGGDDLEKLLGLAETIQERCERADRKSLTFRFGQLLMVSMGLLLIAFIYYRIVLAGGRFSEGSVFIFAMAAAIFILNTIALEWFIRLNQRRTYPDKNALHRILDLIRETEAATAEKHSWSALDRAQFHIRLSRLTIEP